MLAGSRPADVVGAVLADGPGLAGGPTFPTSQSFFAMPEQHGPPDPYALVELTRDLRPPDYAAAFVRLALAGSPLDEPITVTAVFRPPWLEAVAAEPGVAHGTIGEALARYAAPTAGGTEPGRAPLACRRGPAASRRSTVMEQRLSVERAIAADPAAIFAVLSSPAGHVAIDASGMLMAASGDPVTAVGDRFQVRMDRESLHDQPLGEYTVEVVIARFEPDRAIAWSIDGIAVPPDRPRLRLRAGADRGRHDGDLVLRLVGPPPGLPDGRRRHLPGDLRDQPAGHARHPGPRRRAGSRPPRCHRRRRRARSARQPGPTAADAAGLSGGTGQSE